MSLALPLSRARTLSRACSMDGLFDEDDKRDARSRSPMRVPPPMLQKEHSKCSICNDTPLTPQHRTDWNLWLTFGQDQQAIVGGTFYLGILVRLKSVHYSDMGASVPICDACRGSTYAHLDRIARMKDQHDYRFFEPPLMYLGNVPVELWLAYRTVAKLLASQLRLKTVQLRRAVMPIAD